MGRLDDQIKIRGYRIELGEIVAALETVAGITASSATVHNLSGGPTLVAYIVAKPNTSLQVSDIKKQLAAKLPEYMVPSHFVALPSLPISLNGKLDRSALPLPDQSNLMPDSSAPGNVPAGSNVTVTNAASSADVESRLSALVSELLGNKAIGSGDNFFMAGGHSMLGVQLVARIRDAFSVKLSLRQLFMSPTITGLSAEIKKLMPGSK